MVHPSLDDPFIDLLIGRDIRFFRGVGDFLT